MSGRYRTVALQAVGVCVLAAFIFVAFLRPTDPGDLAGIEAPGSGDGPTVVNPPDDGKEKKDKRDRKNGGQGNGEGSSNGMHAGSQSAGGPAVESDDEGSSPPDTGPDDDQYTDLATVLMKQVGEPGLLKEINDP